MEGYSCDEVLAQRPEKDSAGPDANISSAVLLHRDGPLLNGYGGPPERRNEGHQFRPSNAFGFAA